MRKASSLLEPVVSRTMTREPISCPRTACSRKTASSGFSSAGAMGHLEREIDRPRGMSQGANGNVVDAGGGHAPHFFHGDAAARFELDPASAQGHRLAQLRRGHVVE